MIYMLLSLFCYNNGQINKIVELPILRDSTYEIIKLDTFSNYVLSHFRRGTIPFSPNQVDLDNTIRILDSTILAFNKGSKDWTWSGGNIIFKDYYKQLVYGKGQSGDILVWIHCYHKSFYDPQYRKTIRLIKDGGRGVFEVVISLTSEKSEIYISG